MTKANILTIQINPKFDDKIYNLEQVEKIIEQHKDKTLDLIVVPEFFTVGISHDFHKTAEDENGGIVIEFLAKLAKKYNSNIVCGTVIEKSGADFYNTNFVLNRHGEIIGKYRKIHLFNYFGGNEGTYTTAGNKEIVVDLDFAKVGLSVCFDIKYPMHFRKLIKQGAELIVLPSAWLDLNSSDEQAKSDYKRTWCAMNICRATENLVYFVSSNLTGKVNEMLYGIGNSMIVAPMGNVIAQADDSECGVFATIDLKHVRKLKKQVPVSELE